MTSEMAKRVLEMKRIRADVVREIETASQQGDTEMMTVAVRARDAMNDMLVVAGDEKTVRCAERHFSLDEPNAIGRYSGIGCPDCGPEAGIEGDGVEIDGSAARQEVTCMCGKSWVNRYKFDGVAG